MTNKEKQLAKAIMTLAKAIEDGRITGLVEDVKEVMDELKLN